MQLGRESINYLEPTSDKLEVWLNCRAPAKPPQARRQKHALEENTCLTLAKQGVVGYGSRVKGWPTM